MNWEILFFTLAASFSSLEHDFRTAGVNAEGEDVFLIRYRIEMPIIYFISTYSSLLTLASALVLSFLIKPWYAPLVSLIFSITIGRFILKYIIGLLLIPLKPTEKNAKLLVGILGCMCCISIILTYVFLFI